MKKPLSVQDGQGRWGCMRGAAACSLRDFSASLLRSRALLEAIHDGAEGFQQGCEGGGVNRFGEHEGS